MKEFLSGTYHMASLVGPYVEFRGHRSAFRTGFNFHYVEGAAADGDDIKFEVAGAPVAPQDTVAFAEKEAARLLLAPGAKGLR